MQIDITGRDIDITDALRERTIEKFTQHFKRHTQITRVHVTFEVHKLSQIVKVHLHIPGADINATAESEDMYKSIDLVIDKLVAQINKHEDKTTDHHKHHEE